MCEDAGRCFSCGAEGEPGHLRGVVTTSLPLFFLIGRTSLLSFFPLLLLSPLVRLHLKKAKHLDPNRTTVCGSVLHVCV